MTRPTVFVGQTPVEGLDQRGGATPPTSLPRPRLSLYDSIVANSEDMPAAGPRILGVGIDQAIGEAAQNALRRAGLRATVVTVTDDDAGDDRLRDALRADYYDAVNLGAGSQRSGTAGLRGNSHVDGLVQPRSQHRACRSTYSQDRPRSGAGRRDASHRPRAERLTPPGDSRAEG